MIVPNPKTIVYSLEDVPRVASRIMEEFGTMPIFTLTGTLGAGKTTLIKELLRVAGVTDLVVSPTFTLVNTYQGAGGKIFYHFDLYRIQSVEEFLAAGFDEYLYAPDSLCLIEWPAVIEPLLKGKVCHIAIDYAADLNKRILTLAPSL
jgi:tRNA threonylcarbamoyladenosine biosynthesis protein TsaE